VIRCGGMLTVALFASCGTAVAACKAMDRPHHCLPPTLVLNGHSPVALKVDPHKEYTDAGANCLDATGKETLNTNVEVGGQTVSMRHPGTYHIKYSCRDPSDDTAAKGISRKVIVYQSVPPTPAPKFEVSASMQVSTRTPPKRLPIMPFTPWSADCPPPPMRFHPAVFVGHGVLHGFARQPEVPETLHAHAVGSAGRATLPDVPGQGNPHQVTFERGGMGHLPHPGQLQALPRRGRCLPLQPRAHAGPTPTPTHTPPPVCGTTRVLSAQATWWQT
jgi:hypothetical protein